LQFGNIAGIDQTGVVGVEAVVNRLVGDAGHGALLAGVMGEIAGKG
jgi:hypothetical protein